MAQICGSWHLGGQKYFKQCDPPIRRFNITSEDTPNGRIYTGPDGDKYWSMTTMLKKTGDNSWLKEWYERLGQEEAEKESLRCRQRGEAIHSASENYVIGKDLKYCESLAGGYIKLFHQLKRALDTNITEVIAVELPVFSKRMKVGGRLDLFARWKGDLAIIDYKGSNSLKTRDQIEDYSHQLCGYSGAVEEMYGLKASKLINIISNERSLSPTVIITERKDVAKSFCDRIRRFHALLNSNAGANPV